MLLLAPHLYLQKIFLKLSPYCQTKSYDTESEIEAGNTPPYYIEDCNAICDEPTLDCMYNVPVPKCFKQAEDLVDEAL